VAQQIAAQIDTSPVKTFADLLQKEEQKQQEDDKKKTGQPASDNVVATTCSK
jgi:hypothetical protein